MDARTSPAAKPTPPGYTSLTPFLVIDGAAEAIDFYQTVFGARVTECMSRTDGLIAHAELDFGNGRLQLSDPNPAFGLLAAGPGPDVTHSVVLYCPDVDAVVERAVAAGGELREPVSTFVTGDRFASITDPFGQRWSVMTRVTQISDAERGRRLTDWASDNL